MKKIIHSYPNILIGTLAIIFLVTLIIFYSWAVDAAVTQLRDALVTPPPQSTTGFDLDGAAKLDFRGLVASTTSSTGN